MGPQWPPKLGPFTPQSRRRIGVRRRFTKLARVDEPRHARPAVLAVAIGSTIEKELVDEALTASPAVDEQIFEVREAPKMHPKLLVAVPRCLQHLAAAKTKISPIEPKFSRLLSHHRLDDP
jgi:hypothetical protein